MLYSLGYQDFRTLREDGRTYVDKTEHIARVLQLNKYLFLARPRRFGKSLTVSTLAELHSGDRELFAGTWAHAHWDFEAKRSSVVWLKFASSHFATEGMEAGIHNMIDDNAENLGVELPSRIEIGFARRFDMLLKAAAAASPTGKTVLLVDEYDKPIVHYLGEDAPALPAGGRPQSVANRDLLKSLYAVLKDADPILSLVFLTGVSAFSKVSIFSDLNNVTNLSLHTAAATLTGITKGELAATYGDQLAATGVPPEKVRRWYNGYRFAPGAERVYNPWSLLSFLQEGRIRGFWYSTGTPTWLTRILVDAGNLDPTGADLGEASLMGFDIDRVDPITAMFQTGYLTITDYDTEFGLFRLEYPNLEVREAFDLGLLQYITDFRGDPLTRSANLHRRLHAGDLDGVVALIDSAIADVPHQLWQHQGESAFHLVTHVLFRTLGVRLRSEVSTARGRADAIVETPGRVYCFEFKVGASAAEALAQIRERGYLVPYADDSRERVAVGVSFDAERRCVGEWASSIEVRKG